MGILEIVIFLLLVAIAALSGYVVKYHRQAVADKSYREHSDVYRANLRGENNSLRETVKDLQRTLLEIHGSVFNASGQHRISAIERFCYDLFKAVVETAEFKLSEKKEGVSFTIYNEPNSGTISESVWFDSPSQAHLYKPFVTLIFKGEIIGDQVKLFEKDKHVIKP